MGLFGTQEDDLLLKCLVMLLREIMLDTLFILGDLSLFLKTKQPYQLENWTLLTTIGLLASKFALAVSSS